ncbi:MAG: molybdopterin molybdotransferase MoeA [Gammaproteobacteria bacterium]|nr:molybdopterin molybdotransferase MoeA [Gammaproteobacteria bacterium]
MNQCDPVTIPLLPYDEALDALMRHVSALQAARLLPLKQVLGEVLAEDLQAVIDVPPADNSAMDGYALNTTDLDSQTGMLLPVSQRIAAGETGGRLEPGSAARIFTGAPIPAGADAVIMQEQVELVDNAIRLMDEVEVGQNIRPCGNDICAGDIILQKGQILRPQDIGLAASVGLQDLHVFEKIRVGMFFTGDELVEPGETLAAGKIYDSNRYMLYGLLKGLGCEIVDLGVVGDTLEETKRAMLAAANKADLVVTCGGVSVGEEDHVRIAIEALGDLHMWRLRIKPGKPLAFGQIEQTAFIGLPGNPVSVFVTFCLFVCPFIKAMQGRKWLKPQPIKIKSAFDWPKPDSRREFLRARLETSSNCERVVTIYPTQDSAVLTSTVWADGFVEIAEGQTVKVGQLVDYLSYAQFLE